MANELRTKQKLTNRNFFALFLVRIVLGTNDAVVGRKRFRKQNMIGSGAEG